jgi:hypothetical protein
MLYHLLVRLEIILRESYNLAFTPIAEVLFSFIDCHP